MKFQFDIRKKLYYNTLNPKNQYLVFLSKKTTPLQPIILWLSLITLQECL